MVASFTLTSLLDKSSEHLVMISSAPVLVFGAAIDDMTKGYVSLLPLWFVMGFGYSVMQTLSCLLAVCYLLARRLNFFEAVKDIFYHVVD